MKIRNYLDCISNYKSLKLLRIFALFPNEYTGRQISQLAKVHHTTGLRYLEELYNYSIVDKRIAGNAYLYYLQNNYFTNKVILPMIRAEAALYDIVLKAIENKLRKQQSVVAVAIYGSYSRLEETESSDLDLFILVMKTSKSLEVALDDLSDDLLVKYSLALSPHVVTVSELGEKKDKEVFKEIFQHGQWLFGKTEAIKWLRK